MRARVRLAACGVVLALCGALPAGPDGGGIDVDVVSLTLGKPLPKPVARELMTFVKPGTDITLLLSAPDKRMIGLDRRASRLTALADDKGTDLTKGKGLSSARNWLKWPKFTADGHHGTVRIEADGLPAPNAGRVVVAGTLAVLCGSNEKEAVQKGLELVKGAKLTAGPVPMSISSVQEQPGRNRRTVTFSYRGPDDAIRSIRFLDEAGKELKADRGVRTSFSMGGAVSRSREWHLPLEAKEVGVKVAYFEKVETVNVPVDLSIGVGLGAGQPKARP